MAKRSSKKKSVKKSSGGLKISSTGFSDSKGSYDKSGRRSSGGSSNGPELDREGIAKQAVQTTNDKFGGDPNAGAYGETFKPGSGGFVPPATNDNYATVPGFKPAPIPPLEVPPVLPKPADTAVSNNLQMPGSSNAEFPTVQSTVSYGDLVNKDGTVYNTRTGQGYSSPEDLAGALGMTSSAGINWGGIKSNSGYVAGSISSPVGAPTTLQPGQTIGAAPLNIPQPGYDTALAQGNALVAGAVAGSQELQKYIDKLETPKTALDAQQDVLTKRLNELYGQETGKADAQAKAEKQAGVDQKKADLQKINSQINIKNAEYEKLSVDAQGQTIPMALITGQQAQVRLQQASEIGLLSARAQAMQGDIALAIDSASKAVDLIYSKIEEEITAREKQLNLLTPQLNKEQAKMQNAQSMLLQDQRDAISEMKDKAKVNVVLAIEKGVNTKFANKLGEFFDVNSGVAYSNPQDFFKAAGVSSFEEAYQRGMITDISHAAPDKLLSVAEAKSLGVAYGTSQREAAQLGITPVTPRRSSGGDGGGPSSSGGLSSPPKTASENNIRNWLASNWHKKASQASYYDVWGQAADSLRAVGIDPAKYDKVFWDVFRPGEYSSNNKSSSSTSIDPAMKEFLGIK